MSKPFTRGGSIIGHLFLIVAPRNFLPRGANLFFLLQMGHDVISLVLVAGPKVISCLGFWYNYHAHLYSCYLLILLITKSMKRPVKSCLKYSARKMRLKVSVAPPTCQSPVGTLADAPDFVLVTWLQRGPPMHCLHDVTSFKVSRVTSCDQERHLECRNVNKRACQSKDAKICLNQLH